MNSGSIHSTPQNSHNKQVLVKKILENLKRLNTLEDSKESNELKIISDNLKKFTIEEYSKFFQVLANMQHVSHFDSEIGGGILGKSKDLISINEKLINFDPDNFDFCLNEDKQERVKEYPSGSNIYQNQKVFQNINKLIIRKEIPLKNLLKEKFTSLFDEGVRNGKSNQGINNSAQPVKTLQSIPNISSPKATQNFAKISLQSFYEDLLKSIKKEKIEDNNQTQNMIRIHSQYVYNNGIIKFDKEDKLFLDFIIENFLLKGKSSNYSNFYSLCKFWLLQDFLNYEKDLPLIYLDEYTLENVNVASGQLKRRYDSVISEILNRIQTHKDLFELSDWIEFIESLPRINHRVIDHVLAIHDEILIKDYEEIKKKCLSKKPLTETIPQLKLIKNIYQKLKKPSNSSNKILMKMLELPKLPDSHLITQSINFLIETFYSAGKYESEKIKEHAVDQFRELLKINEKTQNPESFIKSRFPLFFRLIRRDKELFLELPDVYSDSQDIVRNTLDKYLPRVLEVIDTFHAEKLISKCGEKCLKIVQEICEGHLFKPENFQNRNMTEDKLFRKIKNYFFDSETSSVNILIALSDKIPIVEFFTKENFIWEKIKQFENKNIHEDVILKIFNKINSIKSEEIYRDLTKIFNSNSIDQEKKIFSFHSFSDKVMLHILYYFIFNNIKLANETFNFNHFKNELSIFLKYYKLISSESEIENFREFFNVLGNSQIVKRNDNVEIHFLIKFIQLIFEIFYSEEKENQVVGLSIGMYIFI